MFLKAVVKLELWLLKKWKLPSKSNYKTKDNMLFLSTHLMDHQTSMLTSVLVQSSPSGKEKPIQMMDLLLFRMFYKKAQISALLVIAFTDQLLNSFSLLDTA